MKEIKRFIFVEMILVIFKFFGSFLCHSYTLLACASFDLFLLFIYFVTFKDRKNKKYKSILSSFSSFLFLMGFLAILFVCFIDKIQSPSWFLLLYLVISFLIRYIVCSFTIIMNYNKKKGLLSYSGMNSTVDFLQYGILLGSLIFTKLSRFIGFFRYADRVGTFLISMFFLVKGFSIIKRSFARLYEEDYVIEDAVVKQIESREEVVKVHSLHVSLVGGMRFIKIHLLLKETISMIDLHSFTITLQDYLLRFGDVVGIYLIDKEKMKKKKVRSKKEDARNSRSRNSKTSTKRKSTSQKNKKS